MSEDSGTPPRLVRRLIGHDAAWNEVADAWASGRFAHAWMISGPRGIGKASFAYLLAKAILTAPPVEAGGLFGPAAPRPLARDLDLAHPALPRIESGAHPDLIAVEIGWTDDKMTKRRTEIVVDDVRAVAAFLSKTPAEGGWRVVVVDAADEMNRSAANALLKSLEEPPKRSVLLLVAHNPGSLLPTIRSRCRRLTLAPLGEAEMTEGLAGLLPEEGAERRARLARMADGSLGEALMLARGDGDALAAEIAALLRAWPRLELAAVSAFAARVAADEERYRLCARLLPGWVAATLRRGAGAPAMGGAEGAALAVPLEQWVEVWEKVSDLFRRAEAVNLDRRHVVLAAFHALVSPAATLP
ncbi:DNA polymerase III subunit delta' [Oleispirillum naphthae]|uniref:DNA polymerase III subunit delta' n=1 Tax=Oleispirillum naphthae TaxID=2838853 RepID=UPI0030822A8C